MSPSAPAWGGGGEGAGPGRERLHGAGGCVTAASPPRTVLTAPRSSPSGRASWRTTSFYPMAGRTSRQTPFTGTDMGTGRKMPLRRVGTGAALEVSVYSSTLRPSASRTGWTPGLPWE